MNLYRKKILEIIVQHPEYDAERSNFELDYLEKYKLLSWLYAIYLRIKFKTRKIGNKNDINSALCYFLSATTQKHTDKQFDLPLRDTYARAGFPDIDMDFDYEKRHLIMEYLQQKYGAENVAKIGSVQTLKTKMAVRRAIKILDPENFKRYDAQGKLIQETDDESFAFENKILNTLPEHMKHEDASDIPLQEAYESYPEFRAYMDKYPEVFKTALRFENCISAYSVHAAGVVLSPTPLKYICPLHMTNDRGEEKTIATQYTMEYVESIGLIKFDILGLSTKTSVEYCRKLIKNRYNKDIDLGNLSLQDKNICKLLSSGKTTGLFQLESHGMQECLKQIQVDRFEDVMVAIAMYRPGPKQFIPDYAAKKKDKSKITFSHPILEKILKSTYSIIVFQENVMQVFMEMAGLPLEDGYKFLKGCAKKKKDIILSYRDKFINGGLKNNIPENLLNSIFDSLEAYSGYAFNLAHSAAYGYECWKTSYLKAYYTPEFFASILTIENNRRMFDFVDKYEEDATRNFGLKILTPDINRSKLDYTIIGEKEILRPLIGKGIGEQAAKEIIKNQPYPGPDVLYNFALKNGGSVNTRVMEGLCDIGVWKGDKKNVLEKFVQIRDGLKKNRGRPSGDLFE